MFIDTNTTQNSKYGTIVPVNSHSMHNPPNHWRALMICAGNYKM